MQEIAIGVDLGGTNIKAGLVDRKHGLMRHISLPTEAEQGPHHVIERVVQAIQQLAPSLDTIQGIGIGSPGSISWDRTTVSYPPNFPGWTHINLAHELQKHLHTSLPVLVENDANVAGLGSAFYGAGKPFPSFIMVTLGTGVGGAIIYEKKIFRGSTGGAGELGHMTIDYEGPRPYSGVAGAIEAYLGNRFLSRHARFFLINRPHSLLYTLTDHNLESLTPRHLTEAAEQGDTAAREILAWAGHKLGAVLGAAVNLLDIRKIVVGGGISAAGDFLLEPARKHLPDFVVPGLRDGLELVRETLGNEVGMLGAAQLIFDYLEAHSLASRS